MNHRLVGLLAALAGALALGFAHYAQYILLLTPCELCLWERWPYRVVLVLGFLTILVGRRLGRFLLVLATAAMFADGLIAFTHVGVEQNWWLSPLPECNGILRPGAPLPLHPATPCDRAVFPIPNLPLSMALMDLIAALIFFALLLIYVTGRKRRFK